MTGKTILLAEDERSLRRAAEVALTRRGFRVITAVNGEEALQLARLHQPDLILLDLLMPKMTGMQVLDALRADPATRALRVLILSNSSKRSPACGWTTAAVRRTAASSTTPAASHSTCASPCCRRSSARRSSCG